MKSRPSSSYWTLLITGTPGTGKTELAHALAKKLKAKVLAEKDLASKKGVGKWDPKTSEYVVDLSKLKKEMVKAIKKSKTNLIIEGHLSCEIRLPVEKVLVLTCPLPELEKRLHKRGYSELKIQDNLFCEEEKYCEKQARTHYPDSKIRILATHRPKKVIRDWVLNWI